MHTKPIGPETIAQATRRHLSTLAARRTGELRRRLAAVKAS